MDRLAEAEYLAGLLNEDEVFGMDDLGNRTTVNLRSGADQVYATDTPNITNRYTAVGGQPLAYDAAGNLTQDHNGYRYVYDYENRITRIFKLNSQTEIDVAQYAYDALGRRICKISYDSVPSVATYYYYNVQWQILAEHDGTAFGNRYVYGNYIDEVLVMNDGADDYYYAHDHLYSPAALLDDTGAVVERYEYDAYGKAAILAPNYELRTTSLYANAYTFTGRQLDILDGGNLHHMHYRFRDYTPILGRFLQHDPLEYIDGCNVYNYVSSSPTHYVDPLGKMGKPIPKPEIPPQPTPTPVPIDGRRNSIRCENGQLVVYIGIPSGSEPNDNCTREHEEQHIKDWKNFYGEDACKGVSDGHLPVGGKGYNEMLRKSECEAYKVGKQCRERALENSKCSDKDTETLNSGIERDNDKIKKYCD